MNFASPLALWQWAALAAIPPAIVLLYFLKLKRQPLEVPSTFLWSRTIEDLHVNTIWQRLRQSLLLFLQLLLIVLIMIACSGPNRPGTQLTGSRFIFLIDNSASMRATDEQPTRLERAKEEVLKYIDRMDGDDAAMVISCNSGARVEQTFTKNRRALRQKVRRIQPTARQTNFDEAFRYASGLANPTHTRLGEAGDQIDEAIPATLYIFSDGGFESDPNFNIGNLEPIFVPIGAEAVENVAIVAFDTERNPEQPGKMQAYARLENYGASQVETSISFFVGDDLKDAKQVTLPAASDEGPGTSGAQFELLDVQDTTLRVEIDWKDRLDLDNVAFAAVNVPRRAEVLLVSPSNIALRRALDTDHAQRMANVTYAGPEILKDEKHIEEAQSARYDLIIYDQCAPAEMPQSNTLFIGAVPPSEGWSAGEPKEVPQVIDSDRVHPLMQLVDVSRLRILDGFAVTAPSGSTTLIDADLGPLLAIAPRQGFEDVVLGMKLFSIEGEDILPNTDWPKLRSFPVFVFNVIRYLGGSRSAVGQATTQPGSAMTIRSQIPVSKIKVESPSGKQTEVRREGQNAFIYTFTDELGVYNVREGTQSDVAQRFAVNLFDSRESNLTVATSVPIGHEDIKGKVGVESARKEYWKWILLGGLIVLVVEWYIYNRRVYV